MTEYTKEDYEQPGGLNMDLWRLLDVTDPRFTKRQEQGARLTSINPQYQIMRMTQAFGPCGDGWGYEIIESDLVNTGTIFNDDGEPVGEGRMHRMRVDLWYALGDGVKRITGIGLTPFISRAFSDLRGVYARIDDEYEKKSLTDALTNAMSKLGMAADVRLGMYDQPDYVQGLRDEIEVREASDSAVAATEKRIEFEAWLADHMDKISTAVSVHELEILFKGARPRVERQGTSEQKKAHKEAKDVRFRELMPRVES